MMHESCFFKNKDGETCMLIMGGKVGEIPSKCEYSNSVLSFNMTSVLNGSPSASGWKPMAPMLCKRSNFAVTVVDNMVYVYGGIMGKGTDSDSHCQMF